MERCASEGRMTAQAPEATPHPGPGKTRRHDRELMPRLMARAPGAQFPRTRKARLSGPFSIAGARFVSRYHPRIVERVRLPV